MIEMKVENILVSPANDSRIVLLKEENGERYLPLFVGPAEANAIALKLENVQVPRPMTHDLAKAVIEKLGASVEQVIVTELNGDIFYGMMIVHQFGQEIHIDSRPSDCMALALRFGVPIYVNEPVLDEAAMVIDDQTGELRPVRDLPGHWPKSSQQVDLPDVFLEAFDDLEKEDSDE